MQAFICVCTSTCYSSFPEGIEPPGPFCSLFPLHCISWKALASVYERTFALSLVCMCPELSMTTACAGHFPYFRFPALRNNHRSEQACARCPPAMSQNSCAALPLPPHTHHRSLWMAYQAEMGPPASGGLFLHTSDVEHLCKVLKGC